MQEQAQLFKTAYEEKIRLLEQEKSDLKRMDSKSSAARDLRSKIQQDEADVAATQAALEETENTIGKKFKSKSRSRISSIWNRKFIQPPLGYCIRSKEWFKKHPDIIGVILKTGIRCKL